MKGSYRAARRERAGQTLVKDQMGERVSGEGGK